MSSGYPYQPDEFGLEFEDVWLEAGDGVKLHAWMMWPARWAAEQRRRRPVVVFFQENAGNMAYRLHFLKPLTRVLDCSAFILSYRGYGASGGRPSEAGLQADAAAALAHVLSRPDVDPRRVVVFGRSLGGAVAIHAAAARAAAGAPLPALVIENTFTRLADVVPKVMPLLGRLIGPGRRFNWLLRNRWDNEREIRGLTRVPILFLSSLQVRGAGWEGRGTLCPFRFVLAK